MPCWGYGGFSGAVMRGSSTKPMPTWWITRAASVAGPLRRALLQVGGDSLAAVIAEVGVGADVEPERLPQRELEALDRGLLHPADADRGVGGDPLGQPERGRQDVVGDPVDQSPPFGVLAGD